MTIRRAGGVRPLILRGIRRLAPLVRQDSDSPGAGRRRPTPGPTEALLRSSPRSGRPSNRWIQGAFCFHPGGRAASGSRKSDAQQSLTGLASLGSQRHTAAIRCDSEGAYNQGASFLQDQSCRMPRRMRCVPFDGRSDGGSETGPPRKKAVPEAIRGPSAVYGGGFVGTPIIDWGLAGYARDLAGRRLLVVPTPPSAACTGRR